MAVHVSDRRAENDGVNILVLGTYGLQRIFFGLFFSLYPGAFGIRVVSRDSTEPIHFEGKHGKNEYDRGQQANR